MGLQRRNTMNNLTKVKVTKVKSDADHDPKECGHRLKSKLIHEKKERPIDSKETVIVYHNDRSRLLIVPERNPTDLAGIWPKSEFNRLKKQSKILTTEEKKAILDAIEKKKEDDMFASEMRKQALNQAQIRQQQTVGTKLNDVEMYAKNQSEYLLERSHELLNEQEDRVKEANCIILATKCRAIRNAQIIEKNLIQKQLLEESKRLDDLMEQSRQRTLKFEEEKERLDEEKKKRYGKELKQQIKDNEIEKLLEMERKEEESRMMNRALIEMQKEEEERIRKQRQRQKEVRDSLRQANLDLEKYKMMQKEEQRIADMRIQEFMRKKAEREEKREAELALIKVTKEREIARLRAQQQRAIDKQAMLDEMHAIRVQEEVERAWREKEKQAAIKKAQDMIALNEARRRQINDVRAEQAMAIARDEAAFHKLAEVQQELFDKDQNSKINRKKNNLKHRREILKQINEKERQRINEIKEKFEDGKAFRLSQDLRDRQISEYIHRKVQRLRHESLPDQYVIDIERQLKLLSDH